ncbi:uncharacterized protein [Macrobrachium rosenbergii]|uniref:uncharacterized protein isoform X2 n=1 Tax=Macrobrachium rosenbergii TaxID=79674 RepID=UPI0034D39C62
MAKVMDYRKMVSITLLLATVCSLHGLTKSLPHDAIAKQNTMDSTNEEVIPTYGLRSSVAGKLPDPDLLVPREERILRTLLQMNSHLWSKATSPPTTVKPNATISPDLSTLATNSKPGRREANETPLLNTEPSSLPSSQNNTERHSSRLIVWNLTSFGDVGRAGHISDDIALPEGGVTLKGLPDVIVMHPQWGHQFPGRMKKEEDKHPVFPLSQNTHEVKGTPQRDIIVLSDSLQPQLIPDNSYQSLVKLPTPRNQTHFPTPSFAKDMNNDKDAQLPFSASDSSIKNRIITDDNMAYPKAVKMESPSVFDTLPMNLSLQGKILLPEPISSERNEYGDSYGNLHLSLPLPNNPIISMLLNQGLMNLELVPRAESSSEIANKPEPNNVSVTDLIEPPPYHLTPPIGSSNNHIQERLSNLTDGRPEAQVQASESHEAPRPSTMRLVEDLLDKNRAVGQLVMGMVEDVGDIIDTAVEEQTKAAVDAANGVRGFLREVNIDILNFLLNSGEALRDYMDGENYSGGAGHLPASNETESL